MYIVNWENKAITELNIWKKNFNKGRESIYRIKEIQYK